MHGRGRHVVRKHGSRMDIWEYSTRGILYEYLWNMGLNLESCISIQSSLAVDGHCSFSYFHLLVPFARLGAGSISNIYHPAPCAWCQIPQRVIIPLPKSTNPLKHTASCPRPPHTGLIVASRPRKVLTCAGKVGILLGCSYPSEINRKIKPGGSTKIVILLTPTTEL